MAVKVMLAPSLANRDDDRPSPAKRAGAEPKPKRRRTSVYDADGNEVFITLICLKCRKVRPLAQFGLRKMADGAIRNQPWCRTCRSGSAAEASKTARSADEMEHDVQAEQPSAAAGPAAEKQLDAGTLAAQVIAALHAGRR